MNFEKYLLLQDKLEKFRNPIKYKRLNNFGKDEYIYTSIPDFIINKTRCIIREIYNYFDDTEEFYIENVHGEVDIIIPFAMCIIKVKEKHLKLVFFDDTNDVLIFSTIEDIMEYLGFQKFSDQRDP